LERGRKTLETQNDQRRARCDDLAIALAPRARPRDAATLSSSQRGHDVRRAIALAALAVLALAGPPARGSGRSPAPTAVTPAEPASTGDMVVSIDWAMTVDCSGPPMPFPIAK
jgi:hypothetical protein